MRERFYAGGFSNLLYAIIDRIDLTFFPRKNLILKIPVLFQLIIFRKKYCIRIKIVCIFFLSKPRHIGSSSIEILVNCRRSFDKLSKVRRILRGERRRINRRAKPFIYPRTPNCFLTSRRTIVCTFIAGTELPYNCRIIFL